MYNHDAQELGRYNHKVKKDKLRCTSIVYSFLESPAKRRLRCAASIICVPQPANGTHDTEEAVQVATKFDLRSERVEFLHVCCHDFVYIK